jgi:hypothetical protein
MGWILIASGVLAAIAGIGAFLFPGRVLQSLFGTESGDGVVISLVRHWGVMVFAAARLRRRDFAHSAILRMMHHRRGWGASMTVGFVRYCILLIGLSLPLSGCLDLLWRPSQDHRYDGAFGGLCRGGPGPATGARCSGH